MTRRSIIILTLCMTLLTVMGSTLTQAQEDDRINRIGHFGGDTLYCDSADGCTLLNASGESLWNVSQPVIDDTFANACEVGISQEIEAGMGTHGPSVLVISCYEGYEPTLKLKAFDEHGKINEIRFPQDYSPVAAATSVPTEETATPTPSETPSPTPSETPSPTPSETPSPTPSETPSPTPSETPSPTPSETPSPTPSETPTATSTPTETETPECADGRDCSVTPTPPPTIEPCSFSPQSPVVTTC